MTKSAKALSWDRQRQTLRSKPCRKNLELGQAAPNHTTEALLLRSEAATASAKPQDPNPAAKAAKISSQDAAPNPSALPGLVFTRSGKAFLAGPAPGLLVLSRERKSKDIFQERSRGHKPPFSKWPGKPFFEPKTGLPGHFVKFMFVAS